MTHSKSVWPLSILLLATLPWLGCDQSKPGAGSGTASQLDPGDRDEFGVLPREIGGFRVHHGATKGYIDDAACKDCHEDLFDSYQEMGMARSFYPLSKDREIENFGKAFHHAATGYRYVMNRRDGKYFLERHCVDREGLRFAEHEVEVAWVIGSGNHVRSYLSQSASGELFLLPLSWYKGIGWRMSPGYDKPGHQRFGRAITHRCMFCHNGYPEVPVGGDLTHVTPVFPKSLPHGIGCQRCHGPGARHVEKALDEDATDSEIRARIINPASLDARQREDLCFSCHLQPESMGGSTMPPKFGKPMFSHRPGDDLADTFCFFDFGSETERREKIEVNQHAYRMRFSRCYEASDGKLSCLSCHDPHRKVPAAERAAFYRSKCLECHALDDCDLEGMGTTVDANKSDCVSCHMLEARPKDVVNVTITDHFIRRKKPTKDLTAPLTDQTATPPPTEPVVAYFPDRGPQAALLEIYRGFAARRKITPERVRAWLDALRKVDPDVAQPHVDIASALGNSGRLEQAIELLTEAARRFPGDFTTHLALGRAYFVTRKPDVACEHLRKARALADDEPEIHLLLGAALHATGDHANSRTSIERALQLRPNHVQTWRDYAQVLIKLDRPGEAIQAYLKIIALNPDELRAYRGLADLHASRRDWPAMVRTLELGSTRSVVLALDLATAYFTADPSRRDFGKALAIAREATARDPSNGRGHMILALTMTLAGAADDVRPVLAAARRLDADPGCCNGLAALDSLRRGETAKARQHFDRFRQDMQRPSREGLRTIVEQIVLSKFR